MIRKTIYILSAVLTTSLSVKSQQYAMVSQYYANPYLSNPALAGQYEGLNVNLGYRQQSNVFKGAPVSQSLTADYGLNEKMGLGLNMYLDKAGLQQDTRFVASYAYHLPLSAEQKLHFGLSLGFSHQGLSNVEAVGNTSDASIVNYKKTFFDGDLGVSYSWKDLKAEVVMPNMKYVFNKDNNITDVSLFYSSVSYKKQLKGRFEDVFLEPKLVYRSIKGYNDIFDMGVETSILNQQLKFLTMFHSSKNGSFGVSYKYTGNYTFSAMYTTATSDLSKYVNGLFEIGIKAHFDK